MKWNRKRSRISELLIGPKEDMETYTFSDVDGEWATINGVHVHFDKDGTIDKGPAEMLGKDREQADSQAHHESHIRSAFPYEDEKRLSVAKQTVVRARQDAGDQRRAGNEDLADKLDSAADHYEHRIKATAREEARSAAPLDHGILNLPLKNRSNIDADIDRFKDRQATESKKGDRAARAIFQHDKSIAEELARKHGASVIERVAKSTGKSKAEARAALKSIVGTRPSLARQMLEKEKQQMVTMSSSDSIQGEADTVLENELLAPAIRYLAAERDPFTPALVMDTMPKSRNGLDCYYYWKDEIGPGVYKKLGKGGWELDVTPQHVKDWLGTFRAMRENGVDVPIVRDHQDPRFVDGRFDFSKSDQIESCANTMGYVVDMKIGEDGKLYGLHQFLGEKDRDIGLKNHVSVGIVDNFFDGKGRAYGSALAHVAATPIPVVPNQGEYTIAASRAAATDNGSPLAASSDPQTGGAPMGTLTFSAEHADAISKLVPDLDGVADTDKPAKIVSYLSSLAAADDADAGGPTVVATLSRAEIGQKAATVRKSLKGENDRLSASNTTLTTQVRELSAKVIKPLDPEAQDLAIDSAEVKFDNLVARGCISPAVRARLFSLIVKHGDKPNTLGLSRAANPHGDKPLAFAIADILADNKAVDIGEATGLQTLSRADVETDEDKAKKAAAEVLKKAAEKGNRS